MILRNRKTLHRRERTLNGFIRKNSDLKKKQKSYAGTVSGKSGCLRQTISKWESGQSLPEPDKIVALSEIFNVSTDLLLKPSEIDSLSLKTEMLENQQKQLLLREKKHHRYFIRIPDRHRNSDLPVYARCAAGQGTITIDILSVSGG